MASTVDVHTLAEFWEVDPRTIQNYADASYETPPLPRVAKGEYDFVKAMKWMYTRLKRKLEIAENSGDETLHALKMEGQIIKNRRDEVQYKRELAQLLDKKTTLIAFSNQMSVIANNLVGLKFDLMRDLESVIDEHEKNKIIETAIEKFRNLVTTIDIAPYVENDDSLELLTENDIEEVE